MVETLGKTSDVGMSEVTSARMDDGRGYAQYIAYRAHLRINRSTLVESTGWRGPKRHEPEKPRECGWEKQTKKRYKRKT